MGFRKRRSSFTRHLFCRNSAAEFHVNRRRSRRLTIVCRRRGGGALRFRFAGIGGVPSPPIDLLLTPFASGSLANTLFTRGLRAGIPTDMGFRRRIRSFSRHLFCRNSATEFHVNRRRSRRLTIVCRRGGGGALRFRFAGIGGIPSPPIGPPWQMPYSLTDSGLESQPIWDSASGSARS